MCPMNTIHSWHGYLDNIIIRLKLVSIEIEINFDANHLSDHQSTHNRKLIYIFFVAHSTQRLSTIFFPMCTCSKCEFNTINNGNLAKSTRNEWKQFLPFCANLKLHPLVRNYISANSADYHKLWNVKRNFCHMFDWFYSIPNKHRFSTKIEFLVRICIKFDAFELWPKYVSKTT